MTQPLVNNLGQWVALDARAPGLQSLAVTIAQAPNSNARWRLRVMALGPQGQAQLGEMVTSSPALGARVTRVVLTAWQPGAESWGVMASLDSGQPSDVETIELTGGTCCAGPAFAPREGIEPVVFDAWTYWTLGSAGPGVVNVPAGWGVSGISAWTVTPGSTLQVASGPALVLPDAGALALAPPIIDGVPTLRGAVAITGVGVGGVAVEAIFR